jgi:hypothetical protein
MSDEAKRYSPSKHGPFTAEGLKPGGYYELSKGFPVQLAPAGPRHGSANVTGALPLITDPLVSELGIDVGHQLATDTVRAPDVSVGGVPEGQSGWAKGAPPLAVEYADVGTIESDLRDKIEEYFGAGSRWVWVVRLVGVRRVEVYSAPDARVVYSMGDELEAPGVLQEKVPVAALFDRTVALQTSLRNLLRRAGYRDLDAVREAGREEGREEGREAGREEGRLDVVQGFVEATIGRALTDDERARVRLAVAREGVAAVIARLVGDAARDASWLLSG